MTKNKPPDTFDIQEYPSQSDAAFRIIVFVLLGISVAGLFSKPPVIMWPTFLCILILPVRTFLKIPKKELANVDHEATEALQRAGILDNLQEIVTQLARKHQLPRPVRLLISRNPYEARASGSWRHHYIILGEKITHKLHKDWHNPENREKAHALLLHELAHLRNKDVQQLGYTRILLQHSFIILTWWTLFIFAFATIAFQGIPALLDFDPQAIENIDPILITAYDKIVAPIQANETSIRQQLASRSLARTLSFIFSSFTFLVEMGGVLWLFFWRPMVRNREYYADYFTKKNSASEISPLSIFARYFIVFQEKQVRSKYQSIRLIFKTKQSFRFSYYKSPEQSWLSTIKGWFTLHPTFSQRTAYLKNPLILNQNWIKMAIPATVLILALEILLISPIAFYQFSNMSMIFTTVSTFVVIATWWLPLLAAHQPTQKMIIKTVALIFTIRYAWLLLNIIALTLLAIFIPGTTLQWLNIWAYSLIGNVSTTQTALPVGSLNELIIWIPTVVLAHLLPLLTLILSLAFYQRINHPLLQTPAHKINWHKRHWRTILAISAVFVLLVEVPASTLIFNSTNELFTAPYLAGYAAGILALVYLWTQRNP